MEAYLRPDLPRVCQMQNLLHESQALSASLAALLVLLQLLTAQQMHSRRLGNPRLRPHWLGAQQR